MLDERVIEQLRNTARELDSQDRLHPAVKLQEFYGNFQSRFGPQQLRALNGEELLKTMHDHGLRDNSLVYWLEFKDDEEFPALFGSIAGGSALKFGIYRRRETGEWMTGSPQNQRKLELEEAIQIASEHRDQLLRGATLLDTFPANGSDAAYLKLQESLRAAAPDVYDTAWGHKYWSLLFPEKLDDFHNPHWQRFFVTKLLQIPPEHDGRYVCAGRFVATASVLGWKMNTLTTVLKWQHGSPHGYWRVGTSDDAEPAKYWSSMRDGGYVAIGWPALGDLSEVTFDSEGKERIRTLLQELSHPLILAGGQARGQ